MLSKSSTKASSEVQFKINKACELMSGPSYPIKMEAEPYCDGPDGDRDEMPNHQGALPYMNTFTKHGASSMAMFYPQLTYDLHPLLLNQRRRSGHEKLQDMTDPLDDSMNPALSGIHLKESARLRAKLKVPRRRSELGSEETYGLPDNPIVGLDETASEFAAKNRKAFFCRSCGKTFKFQTSLLRHNNKVHMTKYQCPTCSRVFSRQAYLDVHTSKQGSSCYLDPALRLARGRPQLQVMAAPTD